MKTCKACSEPKPLDEFWRQAKSKDGRNPRCIPCLELWVRPHPRGIRASDAVAWAREILTKYDHNLLDA